MRVSTLALGAVGGLVATIGLLRHRTMLKVAPELRDNELYYWYGPTCWATYWARKYLKGSVPLEITPGVLHEVINIPGSPDVKVYSYDPYGRPKDSRVVIWLHGGGRVLGSATGSHTECSRLARAANALVLNVEYRLAPQHKYPAALDDAYQTLVWVLANSKELGIDPKKVAIAGASAGGGLSAELAQRAHDNGIDLACQLLVYPMLDDRTISGNGKHYLGWTPAANKFSWSAYLGHPAGEPEDRPYAAAARRKDLTGLPPAWIGIGDLDLFYDECLEYAQRLRSAGVECELRIEPRMYHGADAIEPKPDQMVGFFDSMVNALKAATAD
ncbi:MAG: arylesterase [Propionibacterium sp.]|nr:MAG: arylesterase [Propionibacterium sp.]